MVDAGTCLLSGYPWENVTTPGKTKAPHKRHFEHKAKLKIGAGISGRKNGSKVLTNLSHFSITFSLLKKLGWASANCRLNLLATSPPGYIWVAYVASHSSTV